MEITWTYEYSETSTNLNEPNQSIYGYLAKNVEEDYLSRIVVIPTNTYS